MRTLAIRPEPARAIDLSGDGWFCETGADPQITLAASAKLLPRGWYRLRLDGIAVKGPLHTVLLVSGPGRPPETLDFQLPPLKAPHCELLLRIDRPFDRLRLARLGSALNLRITGGHLRRMSRVGLLTEALARAPSLTLAAAGWRLLGKKLRSRNRMARILSPLEGTDTAAWLARHQAAREARLTARVEAVDALAKRPGIGIIIDARDGEVSSATVASLLAQRGVAWHAAVLGEGPEQFAVAVRQLGETRAVGVAVRGGAGIGAGLTAGLDAVSGAWILALGSGDRLAEGALSAIADRAAGSPQADAIYWDHAMLDADGVLGWPQLKPDWNEPYFAAFDYIGPAVAFRREAMAAHLERQRTWRAEETAGMPVRFALGRSAEELAHIVDVLSFHRLAGLGSARDPTSRLEDLRAAFAERGEIVAVEADGHGHARLIRPRPSPPPVVSLIVPTRDRLDLLRPCLSGLTERTSYPAIEIIIADNGSRHDVTQAYFRSLARDPRIRVLSMPGEFNFAAINNTAVREARGVLIGFLNSDVEVLEPDWLDIMVAEAVRPGIGAVGAKLLYESGLVQHAGVVLGPGGLAAHPHRFFTADHPGYMNRLAVPQYFSAVTAACMVVARERFLAIGGFDAEAFPVAFNDVDLCLRLGERGWRTYWTPYAVLKHKETASRERDVSRKRRDAWTMEAQRLRERWGAVIARDPCYNPLLTRDREDMSPG